MFLERTLLPFRAAWHLAGLLLNPKQRVRHGATFLHLTEGDSFERSFHAYEATEIGQTLLRERPSLQDSIFDRKSLAQLPADSLGFQYWRMIEGCGLDENYYLSTANGAASWTSDPQRNWYRARIGLMHDLRHLLTGYKADPMGELCLLTFRFAQMRHPGLIALMIMMFVAALKRRNSCPIFKTVLEAYRRGKAAQSVDFVEWEFARDRSLSWHRARLGIAPLRYYKPGLAPDLYASAFDDWVMAEA